MARFRATIVGVVLLVLVLAAWPGTASAANAAAANLVFIHHSVGGAWLSAGLRAELNTNGYYVADTNYGWTGGSGYDYGSHTDTYDWPTWFTASVMDRVYVDLVNDTGNTIDPASGGENTIVMFKSCYPNSNVGDGLTDEKAVYNSLLPYFQDHPDKMFVLVTPPPMQSIETPLLTRELCNWLTDRDNGWLKGLTTGNVFTFDLYNVLTNPDAHHRLVSGVESHVVVPGANTLYYPSGDDHPSEVGNDKATAEFVPLLDAWYEQFLAAASSVPTRYQQTDSHITYLGSWSTHWSSLASGGSLYYASAKGSAAIVKFTGTSVELLTKKGSNYGLVQFCLDGTWEPTPVDLYSGTTLYQQSVFSRSGLAGGEHTLIVKCLGEKRAASTGYYVGVDVLRIAGTIAQAATPAPSEQTDSHLRYAGSWSTGWSWSASGSSFTYTDSPGSAMNVSFDGTYLAWVAKQGPVYGKAQVSLDGGAPVVVDLYSSYNKYGQRVYNTGLLADGPHTLSIYWTGQKRSASRGTNIGLDAFESLGGLIDGTAPAPILWRYQQTDSRLTYLGPWSWGGSWAASGGSYYYTATKGAAVVTRFTGTSVRLIGLIAPWCGQAVVTLDGSSETVDFYSPYQAFKRTVYEKNGLSPGSHTLTIRCAGTKQTAAGGFWIYPDALDITGYLAQAPATTRTEQDGTMCAYSGSWATNYTPSASSGSYAYAGSSGSQVTVSFTGTYLAWIAKTSSVYGKALVTLDGGTPFYVDLYSKRTGYRKQVYNTGLLTDGPHTLVIQWSGQKNRASWGSAIGVDAFDILPSGA